MRDGKEIHESNAASALDGIRAGGANLVATAHQRLAEVRRALDLGEFVSAHQAAGSLLEKLSHLSNAQGMMGRLSTANIVRVGELEPGMTIADGGTIASVGPCPGCGRDECTNVMLTLSNGVDIVLDRTDEIVIAAPNAA